MSEIGSGDPTDWPTAQDTNTTKESGATQATSNFANDVADRIIKIMNILGNDPHGGPSGAADVATRISSEHEANGTHKAGIIANVEIAASAAIAESKLNLDIATLALRDGSAMFAVATGTNDYIVAYNPAIPAYTNGLVLFFTPVISNTGNVTINVNSLGVKQVVDGAGNQLPVSVVQSVGIYGFVYSVNLGKFMMIGVPGRINDNALSTNVALLDATLASFLGNLTVPIDSRLSFGGGSNASYSISAKSPSPFPIRIAGVDDAGTPRDLEFGYYTGNIDTNAWNKLFSIHGRTGSFKTAKIPLERLRTNADAAVFDSSDKMIAGTVPLARMQRAEGSAENTGGLTVTSSLTDIVTLNLGTVNLGDRIFITGQAAFLKGATAGVDKLNVERSTGPTVEFHNDNIRASTSFNSPLSVSEVLHISAYAEVTGASGALVLKLTGVSRGSDSTIGIGNGQIRALVLNNG